MDDDDSLDAGPQALGGGRPSALASSQTLGRPVGVLPSAVLRNAAGLSPAEVTPPQSLSSTCTRAIARQGTSAVAHPGLPPEDDDPLLGFAPYLHPAARANSITPERQRRFVATLAATGIVQQAARSIGKSMEALYKLRHKPGAEGFTAAWDAALERGMQRLEDCALQRAMQGTPTPIVSGGKLLDWYDKPDNNLLRFLLQHRMSGRYGVQQVQPGHPVYESIKAQVLAEESAREEAEGEEVLESIDAFIDTMVERRRAAKQMFGTRHLADDHAEFLDGAGGTGCMPAGDWG